MVLQTHLGEKYFIEYATQSLEERCQILDQITQIYNHQHFLGQTTLDQIDLLLEENPNLRTLITYPPFTIDELVQHVGANLSLPCGITRFSVTERALHLNYPLSNLTSLDTLEISNQKLNEWSKLEFRTEASVTMQNQPIYMMNEIA